jgi:hypothetical protein
MPCLATEAPADAMMFTVLKVQREVGYLPDAKRSVLGLKQGGSNYHNDLSLGSDVWHGQSLAA